MSRSSRIHSRTTWRRGLIGFARVVSRPEERVPDGPSRQDASGCEESTEPREATNPAIDYLRLKFRDHQGVDVQPRYDHTDAVRGPDQSQLLGARLDPNFAQPVSGIERHRDVADRHNLLTEGHVIHR